MPHVHTWSGSSVGQFLPSPVSPYWIDRSIPVTEGMQASHAPGPGWKALLLLLVLASAVTNTITIISSIPVVEGMQAPCPHLVADVHRAGPSAYVLLEHAPLDIPVPPICKELACVWLLTKSVLEMAVMQRVLTCWCVQGRPCDARLMKPTSCCRA